MEHKTKKTLLLVVFLTLIVLAFLPTFNFLGNSSQLIFGVPISILWILTDLILLVILSVVAYLKIFRQWAIKIDSRLK